MHLLTTISDARWNGMKVVEESCPEHDQRERILAALGQFRGLSPGVDDRTLSRYYTHLTASLSFPFAAYYPEPKTLLEEEQYRCTVLELLDPVHDVCDEFEGIFCKTRKGEYEINLPLVELELPADSPNLQFIEDYGNWFWNWR